MTFQIHALPKSDFERLFSLSDQELKARNIHRMIADSAPGFPCRVSLQDAEIGEELLLLNYQHLSGQTPYASSHAIYVRKGAQEARLAVGQVPKALSRRLLSVRGFDSENLMIAADVVDGEELSQKLISMLEASDIAFVHIHHAKQGCYAAKATRA